MLTLLKMYRLLLLLLLLSIAPTGAEVVTSMADCAEFFLQNPPDIPGILERGNILNQNRYKPICQTFKNVRRFVTLYDTENKIPVFSAYKYRKIQDTGRPSEKWKIEPQLEDRDDNKNMETSSSKSSYNQAVNADYIKQGYDRGHLFPNNYASNTDDKESTFTLTNAVPQLGNLNRGRWRVIENKIKCVLDEYCKDSNDVIEAFLVTGAKPGTKTMHNKVNVPSMLWSAFCCRRKNTWLASAYWGNNVQDSSDVSPIQMKTLEELYEELSTPNSKFKVFSGTHCPRQTTVAQLYQEIKKTCKSLPPILTTSAPSTTHGSGGLLGVLGVLLIGIFSALATFLWLKRPS